MPHRSYASTANYRFGFNGKENDNEPKGLGNQQDYGMRIYDTRLGKFLSVDPITNNYPELTPYQFSANSPILNIDLDGLEPQENKLVENPLRIVPKDPGKVIELNPNKSSRIQKFVEYIRNELKKLVGRDSKLPPRPTYVPVPVPLPITGPGIPIPSPSKPGSGIEIPLPISPGSGHTTDPNKPGDKGKPEIPSPIDRKDPNAKPGFENVPDPNGKETHPIPENDGDGDALDKKPDEGPKPTYEQYVLLASKNGKYPVMSWGQEKPTGFVTLKRGDVWKYGTTVNPTKRYSQVFLRGMNLTKRTEATGTLPYVLAREAMQIVSYFLINGTLPPGNKAIK